MPFNLRKISSPTLSLVYSNALFSRQITQKNAIMEITNFSEKRLSMNHLLLIFKYFVYNASEDHNISIKLLKVNI